MREAASSKNAGEPKGCDAGECKEQCVEELLRDARDAPASGDEPGADGGDESGVEEQRAAVDEAEIDAEWDFEAIDDEEEPGAGADEFELRQRHGDEEKRHDRAGGVRDHRGEPGEQTMSHANQSRCGTFS